MPTLQSPKPALHGVRMALNAELTVQYAVRYPGCTAAARSYFATDESRDEFLPEQFTETRDGRVLSFLVFRLETDEELNVKARLPAWAKGKSVILDMTKTHIRLALQEEQDKAIIEVHHTRGVAHSRCRPPSNHAVYIGAENHRCEGCGRLMLTSIQ